MHKPNKYTILYHLLVQYHYITRLFNFGQFKFSLELLLFYSIINLNLSQLLKEIFNERNKRIQ